MTERRPQAEQETSPGYRVAIVGATGLVGRGVIEQLESRQFPVKELVAFSSERSVGTRIPFNSREVEAQKLTKENYRGFDLVFITATNEIALKWAPLFSKDGAWVIDTTSAHRMDPEVPLVVPEVNPQALDRFGT